MRLRTLSCIFVLICLLLLSGCPEKPTGKPTEPPKAPDLPIFERVPSADIDLREDSDAGPLRFAIQKSLAWYAKVPDDRSLAFGNRTITAGVLRKSLAHFLALLDAGRIDRKSLDQEFDVFRVVPPDGGRILVTGYFEPVLDGSLKAGGPYQTPIYGLPADLLQIDLERFDAVKFKGEKLIGRVENKKVVPYFTRSEIDGKKALERSGLQLAWLKDPVDCFFLHVQGSGVVRLPDGKLMRVGYAGANGRPYRSIGKTLIESGAVSREEMSLQAIRAYLQAHPESRDRIMWGNESYVFFRWVSEGPLGSLDAVLTSGRSIATDPKFHPKGALAFLISEKPEYGASGQVGKWERFGRWVLNQDTGGAIKGPGRIDLFCGTGAAAERVAGPMKQSGQLHYFIKKGLLEDNPS
ncbi:MAG: MltA domain-containing protein [Desulfobacteraceae bacterium]|nr:MltA domain-containing protein [Desulfobacteraceae bacterium]